MVPDIARINHRVMKDGTVPGLLLKAVLVYSWLLRTLFS